MDSLSSIHFIPFLWIHSYFKFPKLYMFLPRYSHILGNVMYMLQQYLSIVFCK
jgi:hypothetical protein